jgi:hypothetical protein
MAPGRKEEVFEDEKPNIHLGDAKQAVYVVFS